ISENIKELTASRLSTIILYYLGTALFILLLINFILFDHYNSKETQLQEEYQGIANLQNEITQLQSELKVKKQFIEQSNVPENYAFAFYADRLACCAHDGISFSEVAICPVLGKVKKDKVIGFYNNTLHVVGTALNSTTFSIFLEKINQSAWIKKINKQVYVFDNENDNAAFELEIILNDATD
ncbi:MAG TPA: hypothetical protein VK205_14610, partial [Prolixibacteraceae bacterium]|nr:hypothetical protein [Prolixibacteraceae bacterium]